MRGANCQSRGRNGTCESLYRIRGVEVLAVTRFDDNPYPRINGVVMPTVWRKKFGRGKVFFSALGHGPDEFEHEAMREILRRGLLWASR